MIKREFNFLLDAWVWCHQHGVVNWQEKVQRKDWSSWVVTVSAKDMKTTANT